MLFSFILRIRVLNYYFSQADSLTILCALQGNLKKNIFKLKFYFGIKRVSRSLLSKIFLILASSWFNSFLCEINSFSVKFRNARKDLCNEGENFTKLHKYTQKR